jgi:hypothetical protein
LRQCASCASYLITGNWSGATDPDRKPLESPAGTKTNVSKKIGAKKLGAAMADAAPSAEPALPAIDSPVLIGLDQIAAWLGISRGRCRGLVDDGTLPTFTMPGRATRCALKASIGAVMEEYASRQELVAKAPRKPKLPK